MNDGESSSIFKINLLKILINRYRPLNKWRIHFTPSGLAKPLLSLKKWNIAIFGTTYACLVVFMPRMQYFSVPQLFNPNILELDDGRIEALQPKLLSSNHYIQRDDTRHELGTAP